MAVTSRARVAWRPGRRATKVAVPLMCAGLLAAGCGSPSGPTAASSNGTLTYATNGLVQCLDPQAAGSKLTAIIDRNLFDSLVVVGKDGTVQPWLARSWTVSPDARTYTFTLRSGVTFHDGTPLDAASVKATLDHAVDPRTRSLYASSLLGAFAGADVVDDRTVRIRLARAHSPLLRSLATPYLGIQSAKSLTGSAADLCSKPVGSGPFKLAGWTKGTSIALARNTAYQWAPPTAVHSGPARLAGVTFSLVAEDSARFGALTSGQADLIDDVPGTDVATLEQSDSYRYERTEAPGVVLAITLNATRAPLNDERVRQAVQRSVDLDQLVRSVYAGQYTRAWSPLSPTTPDYEPATVGSWPYDTAAAGRLLDEAGWTGRDSAGYRTRDGRRLTLRWPVGSRLVRRKDAILAQGIQAEAKKAGIDIQYVSEDTGAFIKDVTTQNLDIYSQNFRTASPDVLRYQFASDQLPAKGGANLFHISDPQLDGWLDGAVATTDAATQRRDYSQAQLRLVRQAYSMPLYVPAELLGMSTKVTGLTFDPSVYLQFYDASVDGS
jgi:peptide/nickel transport system substrate-binding protein